MRIIINKDPHIKCDVKDLMDKPVVIRIGDITEDAAKLFSTQMTDAYNTGQDIIPVIIDSYGGDVYALLSIISDIENSRLPVATICVGKAMSAGAVLLAHGHRGLRFMDPNATIMVHEVSTISWGKMSELRASIEETERLNQIIFQKMALACGHKDRSYFLKLIGEKQNVDLYLNALDAKKIKVIDHIGVPEFHVNISAKINFMVAKTK